MSFDHILFWLIWCVKHRKKRTPTASPFLFNFVVCVSICILFLPGAKGFSGGASRKCGAAGAENQPEKAAPLLSHSPSILPSSLRYRCSRVTLSAILRGDKNLCPERAHKFFDFFMSLDFEAG